MATATANPTGDNSVTGTWTGTAGSRYSVVNDYPDSTGATSLTCSAVGVLTFTFTPFSLPSNAQIIQVALLYYDDKSTTQTATIGGQLIVNGTSYSATGHSPTKNTWVNETDTWTTNPKTSKTWDPQDLNGTGANPLQAFGWNVTAATSSVRVSSIQLQVTYTLTATPGIGVSGKPSGAGVRTINRNSSLFKGLKFLVGLQEGGGQPCEYLTGVKATNQLGTTNWDNQAQAGLSLNNPALQFSVPAFTVQRPYTIFGVAQVVQNSGQSHAIFALGASSDSPAVMLLLYTTGQNFQVYCEAGASSANPVYSGGIITFGNWYAVVATDDGTTPRMVVKDLTAGAINSYTGTTFANANTTSGIFLGSDKYTEYYTGNVALGGYASRAWSLSEMVAWVNDPFVLLRPAQPLRKRIYYPGTALTQVSQALGIPIELLATITQNVGIPVENIGTLLATSGLPIELLQGISQATGVPLEALGGLLAAQGIPVESGQTMIRTAALPMDSLQPLMQTTLIPLEQLQGLLQSAGISVESLGLTSQASGVPVESLSTTTQSSAIPIESLQGLAHTTGIPFELLQGLLQMAGLPMESLGTATQTGSVPMESLGGVMQTGGLPIEALQGLLQTGGMPIESLAGLAVMGVMPIECLGLTAVSQNAVIPIEVLSTALQSGNLPMDSLQGIVVTAIAPMEGLGGITTTVNVPLESLTTALQAGTVPVEVIQALSVSTGIPMESLFGGTYLTLSSMGVVAICALTIGQPARFAQTATQLGSFTLTIGQPARFAQTVAQPSSCTKTLNLTATF